MEVEFYNGLDEISIYNWTKITETSDLRFLVKSGKYEKENFEDAVLLYQKLQQDYIDLFGVNKDSEYLLILIKRKIKLTAELILDNSKRYIYNDINLLQVEINFLINQQQLNGSISLDEQLISMGKFLGYGLKAKETTVTEFKATFNVIENYGRKNNKGERDSSR